MIADLLESNDEAVEREYVGSARIEDGVQALVTSIANKLSFDPTTKAARKGGYRRALSRSTKQSGGNRSFVLLIGDLGSHHSTLSADVFRGFAIADKIAPFAVINDQDARAARSFTLIHELAHIWLGQTGVSGDPEPYLPLSQTARVERFCDDVASQFLLPTLALSTKPTFERSNREAAAALIKDIADQWSVSEPMVAYRFSRLAMGLSRCLSLSLCGIRGALASS